MVGFSAYSVKAPLDSNCGQLQDLSSQLFYGHPDTAPETKPETRPEQPATEPNQVPAPAPQPMHPGPSPEEDPFRSVPLPTRCPG